VKHEVKLLPVNFSDPVQCGFGEKSTSQPKRNIAGNNVPDTTAAPPRKWKHRHINRHFSSTSEHQADATRHVPVPETAVKTYPSPSWLVAERPVPLSSVCHQGIPVVKGGSPVAPLAAVLPSDLSRRFLADSTDMRHAATLEAERSAMLRKRRLDDQHDPMPFAMSPNVPKFPAFNYGIAPVDIATGYLPDSIF